MVTSWQSIGLIMAALVVLGYIYNQIVAKLEQQGYTEGFLSLLVAAGVGFTLAGVAVIDYKAALLTLAAFAASGTPMIAGSIWRYWKKRKQEQERVRLGNIDEA